MVGEYGPLVALTVAAQLACIWNGSVERSTSRCHRVEAQPVEVDRPLPHGRTPPASSRVRHRVTPCDTCRSRVQRERVAVEQRVGPGGDRQRQRHAVHPAPTAPRDATNPRHRRDRSQHARHPTQTKASTPVTPSRRKPAHPSPPADGSHPRLPLPDKPPAAEVRPDRQRRVPFFDVVEDIGAGVAHRTNHGPHRPGDDHVRHATGDRDRRNGMWIFTQLGIDHDTAPGRRGTGLTYHRRCRPRG